MGWDDTYPLDGGLDHGGLVGGGRGGAVGPASDPVAAARVGRRRHRGRRSVAGRRRGRGGRRRDGHEPGRRRSPARERLGSPERGVADRRDGAAAQQEGHGARGRAVTAAAARARAGELVVVGSREWSWTSE